MHGIVAGIICGIFFGLVIVIKIYKNSNNLQSIQSKLTRSVNNNIHSKKFLLGPALFIHSTCTLFGLIIGALYEVYSQKFEYASITILIFTILFSIVIALLLKKYVRNFFSYIKSPLGFFIIIFGLLLPMLTST
jgi:Na+/glutamate symporter